MKKPYTIGFVLLIIATILSLIWLFWMISILLFIIGSIFIFLSDKKLYLKLLSVLIPIIIFRFFIVNFSNPIDYYIPDEYKGKKITVVYGVPCATATEVIDGRFIYKIPEDGILLVKDKFKGGIVDENYFVLKNSGIKYKASELEYSWFDSSFTSKPFFQNKTVTDTGVFNGGVTGISVDTSNYTTTFFFYQSYNTKYDNSWKSEEINNQKIINKIRKCY